MKVTINNEKLISVIGYQFEKSKMKSIPYAGYTRDRSIFNLVEKIVDENIISLSSEKEGEKFILHYKNNVEKTSSNWLKSKSFMTSIQDLILFSPTMNENVKSAFNNTKERKNVFEWFLSNGINNVITKEIKELWSNRNKLFSYWKKLSEEKNGFFVNWVFPRFNLFFYLKIKYAEQIFEESAEKVNALDNRCDLLWKITDELFEEVVDNIDENLEDDKEEIEIYNPSVRFDTLSVKRIFSFFKSAQWTIPKFQRDYVWNTKKIVALMNSINKNYPIGSLLIGKSNQISFDTKNEIIEVISEDKINDSFIVLDGQQRLTSILLIYDYLNIMESASSTVQFPGLYDTLSRKLKISNIAFYNNQFYEKVDKNGNIKSKIDNPDTHKIIREIIGKHEIFLEIHKGVSANTLIDIFENINIGSTNLTEIELLHAFFHGVNRKHDLIGEIEAIKKEEMIKEFNLKPLVIAQAMKLRFDIKKLDSKDNNFSFEKDINLSLRNLFKSKELDITKNIDSITKNNVKNFFSGVRDTMNYLKATIKILNIEYSFKSFNFVPNISYIFSIFAFLFKNKVNVSDVKNFKLNHKLKKEADKIIAYISIRSLNGDYTAGTAAKAKEDIIKILKEDVFTSKLQLEKNLSEAIKSISYGSKKPLYKLIIAELIKKKPLSLIDGSENIILKQNIWNRINDNQHHFIPTKCSDLKDKITNNVRNIFLISNEENIGKISNKSPLEYLFSEIEDVEIRKQISKSHLLDFEMIDKILKNKNEECDWEILFEKREKKIEELLFKMLEPSLKINEDI